MADAELIDVEVACGDARRQALLKLCLPAGTTAREAAVRSGAADAFAEVDAQRCPLGIFGSHVSDEYVLSAGDRVELYRPLQRDPRTARRAAAAAGRTLGGTDGRTRVGSLSPDD